MPIDDALDGMEQSKEETKKEKLKTKDNIIESPHLFPTEKTLLVYEAFRRVSSILESNTTRYHLPQRGNTKPIIETIDSFSPYREYYLALRNCLDYITSELGKWSGVFEGILDPNTLEGQTAAGLEMPGSLRDWILEQTNIILITLNEIDIGKEATNIKHNTFEVMYKGHLINQILRELHNTSGLVEVVLLGRGLNVNIQEMNGYFSVLKYSSQEIVPIPANEYLQAMDRLYNFSKGKSAISYDFSGGHLRNLEDLTPKKSLTERLLRR